LKKRELARIERERIKAQAIMMYETGMSADRVGEILGISGSTIYGYLREVGKVRKRGETVPVPRLHEDDLHRTVELYQSGLSTKQVGDILGLTHSAVQNRLERAGCPMRPRNEALAIRWRQKIDEKRLKEATGLA
jgi:predicted transcriptional regulator